jgi:hypothetical protein
VYIVVESGNTDTARGAEMKLKHEGKVVGTILTNRSLTLDECFEILDIDIDETEGGDPKWDYEKFEMEYED